MQTANAAMHRPYAYSPFARVFEVGNQAMLDRREELYLLVAAPGGYRFEGHFRLDRDYVAVTERDNHQARAIVFVLSRVT
jgi:hypothetical protein